MTQPTGPTDPRDPREPTGSSGPSGSGGPHGPDPQPGPRSHDDREQPDNPPQDQPEPDDLVDGEVLEGDVVDGEVVEPTTSAEAEADALLAEAIDAEVIEAEFSAAEADLAAAASGQATEPDPVALLTADLQRVHAEYSNYRKRVERDRELVRERAVEAALATLLPVLDDIGRAREHGELVGGFRSVGEALEAAVAKLGLITYGAVGEPFDPTRHEALMREEREGVTEPTVVTVLQVGYEMNGRVVRPARVSVAGAD